MQAMMNMRGSNAAITPAYSPRLTATLVVLAVNPACPPDRAATIAGEAATWSTRPTPIDREPTWEDAAWQ
jgi:hypothetical protein